MSLMRAGVAIILDRDRNDSFRESRSVTDHSSAYILLNPTFVDFRHGRLQGYSEASQL
jgi:hypothetical protein